MQDNRTMTFHWLWSRLGIREIAAALLLIVLLVAAAPAASLTEVMKTPYFTVHFAPADRQLAESTADTARVELIRIANDLGYTIEPNQQIPLLVYGSHMAFIKAGNIQDRMTVGTAQSGDETISIDASGTLVATRPVVAHEISHAITFRILGMKSYALPLWANEGIAKQESETYTGNDDSLLAESATNGQLIPLGDLSKTFPSDRRSLAYAESWSAVRYIVKQHGPSSLKIMLAELAQSGSFDMAMARATGKGSNQLVKSWNASLARRFEWARALQIGGAFLWPIMAVLAVAAFLVRRKRMRDAARQWDWEEFEESMERQLREWPHR